VGYQFEAYAGDACDFYFGLQLAKTGGEFFFVDEFVYLYRVHAAAITNRSDNNASYKRMRIIFDEYPDFFNV
jgi:hypothetical protein